MPQISALGVPILESHRKWKTATWKARFKDGFRRGSCAPQMGKPRKFHGWLQQSIWLFLSSMPIEANKPSRIKARKNILALPPGCHCDLIYHFMYFPICIWIIISNGSRNGLAWCTIDSGFQLAGSLTVTASHTLVKFINKCLGINNAHCYGF